MAPRRCGPVARCGKDFAIPHRTRDGDRRCDRSPVALYIARAAARERIWWQAILLASILLPPLALGILLSLAFGSHEPIGALLQHIGVRTSNSASAFVVTQVYVSIGYYILAAIAAFDGVPQTLELHAALLGKRPPDVFWRITFPLARLGLAVAVSIAWVRALGEFGAVVITAYYPAGMPVQLWVSLQSFGLPAVMPLLVISLWRLCPCLGWRTSSRSDAMFNAHIVKLRRDLVVDVTIQLPDRSAIGLCGASGAGKSTVLSCIAGFEEPDDGFVRHDGRQLFPPSSPLSSRPVGYMTQDANLFPHLTVAENVRFGLNGDPSDREWTSELRDRLQLQATWVSPASRVSGGQARRVALARMLARRPALVLLDEPFAGLDRYIVRGLLEDLVQWQARLGFKMIVVDHQVHILERLCAQAVVIEAGHVVQTGSWDEVHRVPATPLLEQLLEPL